VVDGPAAQGQYLAFIYAYSKIDRAPPAEADFQRFFEVSPPSVHRMVLELERTVPAITIGSDFDGPFKDGRAYASKFTGKHSHRVLDGIGHNVPQEAPEAFAKAVVDVDGYTR
jgi:pimeloyl-ACP methyl ester carboxylesterase